MSAPCSSGRIRYGAVSYTHLQPELHLLHASPGTAAAQHGSRPRPGALGKATWYKISYIYVSVKDLAELTSEGETFTGAQSAGAWPGTCLLYTSRCV